MEMFLECGWSAWLILLAAIIGFVVAMVAVAFLVMRLRGAATLGVAAVVVGVVIVGIGFGGEALGRNTVDDVLTSGAIDPAQRDAIRRAGYAEAAQCRYLGFYSSPLPLAAGLLVTLLGFGAARKRAEQRDNP